MTTEDEKEKARPAMPDTAEGLESLWRYSFRVSAVCAVLLLIAIVILLAIVILVFLGTMF